MKVKRGGLKLKNINKKGFKALFDMINSASAKINLLTYSSLKGFMIELSVSEQASEYFSLKGNMFVEPVTNYILKFAVITKDNDFLESFLLTSKPDKLIVVRTGNIPNPILLKIFDSNLELIKLMISRSNLIEISRTEIAEHD